MAVDRYTKAVLTVIAVCLVWLSMGPSLIPPVKAQNDRVVRHGVADAFGHPVTIFSETLSLHRIEQPDQLHTLTRREERPGFHRRVP